MRKLGNNGGICVAVTDEEILQAQKRLAGEGIFAQPAAAVPLAAVRKLTQVNVINGNDTLVCIATGGGLKYTAVFQNYDLEVTACKLEDLSKLRW